MEGDTPSATGPGHLVDGLQHPGFVIGPHQRAQQGLWRQFGNDLIRRDPAAGIGRHPNDLCSLSLQLLETEEDGRMLNLGGDDAAPRSVGSSEKRTLECQRIRFRARSGKADLPRLALKDARDGRAGPVESGSQVPAAAVDTRRIARERAQPTQTSAQRVADLVPQRSAGVVVEVDHGSSLLIEQRHWPFALDAEAFEKTPEDLLSLRLPLGSAA